MEKIRFAQFVIDDITKNGMKATHSYTGNMFYTDVRRPDSVSGCAYPMETKDDFRRELKLHCPNGGGSRYHSHSWGCTCCVKFRLVGHKNHRNLLRRKIRRHFKRMDMLDGW